MCKLQPLALDCCHCVSRLTLGRNVSCVVCLPWRLDGVCRVLLSHRRLCQRKMFTVYKSFRELIRYMLHAHVLPKHVIHMFTTCPHGRPQARATLLHSPKSERGFVHHVIVWLAWRAQIGYHATDYGMAFGTHQVILLRCRYVPSDPTTCKPTQE